MGGTQCAPPYASAGCSNYALDLAAIDLQIPGDGALTAARVVPIPNRTLQCWYIRCHRRCIVLRLWRGLVFHGVRHIFGIGTATGLDKYHEQLILWGTNRTYVGDLLVLPAQRLMPSATGVVHLMA
jgi:hypothetical protein